MGLTGSQIGHAMLVKRMSVRELSRKTGIPLARLKRLLKAGAKKTDANVIAQILNI